MFAKIKELAISLLIVLSLSLVVIYAGENRISEREISQRTGTDASPVALSLWYSDASYEAYITSAIEAYGKNHNVNISLRYVAPLEYISSIESANNKGEGPDIYIIGSEYLQNISRISAARRTETDEEYSEKDFTDGTWKNMDYAEVYYGYPLGFDTAVLMYNKDKVETPAKTFKEIIAKMDENNENSPSKVLCFDTNKFICNYGFIGYYAKICGDSGYDVKEISLDNEKIVQSALFYRDLCHKTMGNVSYNEENILSEFEKGNIMYTIENSNVLKQVENAGINADFTPFPDLTEELKGASLSVTDLAVVNEFSSKNVESVQFARFLSLDYADYMYPLSGVLPLAKGKNVPSESMAFYEEYTQSATLPKVMAAVDYWSKVKDALVQICGGSEAEQVLSALNDEIILKVNE